MSKENEKYKILLLTKPTQLFDQKNVYSKSKILQFLVPKLEFSPKVAIFKHSFGTDTKVAELIEIKLKREPEITKESYFLYTILVI